MMCEFLVRGKCHHGLPVFFRRSLFGMDHAKQAAVPERQTDGGRGLLRSEGIYEEVECALFERS